MQVEAGLRFIERNPVEIQKEVKDFTEFLLEKRRRKNGLTLVSFDTDFDRAGRGRKTPEKERIKKIHEQRKGKIPATLYSFFN